MKMIREKQILMPTDDMDFPYVDDSETQEIWATREIYEEDEEYYGKTCTSCGEPHNDEEVFIRLGAKGFLCKDCVVIVTQADMLNAWKEKHIGREAEDEIEIVVGDRLFSFEDFQQWVNMSDRCRAVYLHREMVRVSSAIAVKNRGHATKMLLAGQMVGTAAAES